MLCLSLQGKQSLLTTRCFEHLWAKVSVQKELNYTIYLVNTFSFQKVCKLEILSVAYVMMKRPYSRLSDLHT